MIMQSLFLSLTSEWPFQDHLLQRTLSIQRSKSQVTLTATVQSLPIQCYN